MTCLMLVLGGVSGKMSSNGVGLNRQIADIESRRVGKRIDGGLRGLLSIVISIASALVLGIL